MSEKVNSGIKHSQFHHPTLDAMINISIASEYIRQNLDNACKKEGITGVQYNILRILKRNHPKGCTRSEVLDDLIEKSIDVTRTITTLEQKGLVKRIRTNEDRRLSISMITDDGINILKKLDPHFYVLLEEITSKMSEGEWQNISKLSTKIYT